MMFGGVMIERELIDYIDEIMNCDDILLSAMVTKFLNDSGCPQSGGLQLEVKSIKGLEGLSKCFSGNS